MKFTFSAFLDHFKIDIQNILIFLDLAQCPVKNYSLQTKPIWTCQLGPCKAKELGLTSSWSSHVSNFRYFQNSGFLQWGSEQENWNFSKYSHIIYHLKAFFMLIDNLIRTKVLKSVVKKLLVIVFLVFCHRTLKIKIEKKGNARRIL